MIVRRILLPVSGPIFMVFIIWQFTQIWNDFLLVYIVAGKYFVRGRPAGAVNVKQRTRQVSLSTICVKLSAKILRY